jgi:hypothetical protein
MGATNASEMASQLLFGEMAEVLEAKGRQWCRVRCIHDNFVGWAATNQLLPITPSELDSYRQHHAYSLEPYHAIMGPDHYLPVVMGAQLPGFDGMRFRLEDTYYTFSGQAIFPEDVKLGPEFILKIARRYLSAPFLWGGRSPMGIDAPGLVQMVFKIAGLALPREASQQIYLGETVDFVEQAQPGDIAFFENRASRIGHCGIILPNQEIIHAYGSVRIDLLDHFGIFNRSTRRYTHSLRLIKRFLPSQKAASEATSSAKVLAGKQVELF